VLAIGWLNHVVRFGLFSKSWERSGKLHGLSDGDVPGNYLAKMGSEVVTLGAVSTLSQCLGRA
jgi:hypothetical protein